MIRTAFLQTRTRLKPIRSKPRKGPLRSVAYRRWIRSQKCIVCGDTPTFTLQILQVIDPCHTENNGMGSKGPDSSCAPLCRGHHQQYDAGRDTFEARYQVDMQKEAAALWALWQSGKEE